MNARLLAIAGLVALAGCSVPNDASVRIYGMCYPPEPTDAGVCAYAATCGSLFLGGVAGDVSSTSIYGPLVWPIQVDNQRPSNKDRAGGVETATARIEGYRVSYTTSGLSTIRSIPSVDVAISGHSVLPAGSTVVIAPVVPASVGTLLFGLMGDGAVLDFKAELKAFGHYGDGSKFETGAFQVVGKLGKRAIPVPTSANACPDPTKPVYVGSCPQALQTSVVHCIAGT